jgi:hypothetical protein
MLLIEFFRLAGAVLWFPSPSLRPNVIHSPSLYSPLGQKEQGNNRKMDQGCPFSFLVSFLSLPCITFAALFAASPARVSQSGRHHSLTLNNKHMHFPSQRVITVTSLGQSHIHTYTYMHTHDT